jgi:hypothetical protein
MMKIYFNLPNEDLEKDIELNYQHHVRIHLMDVENSSEIWLQQYKEDMETSLLLRSLVYVKYVVAW